MRHVDRERKAIAGLMRDLITIPISRRERRAFEVQARRQSLAVTHAAREAGNDESEIIRWIEEVADREAWTE